jgi:hypothetical protein
MRHYQTEQYTIMRILKRKGQREKKTEKIFEEIRNIG